MTCARDGGMARVGRYPQTCAALAARRPGMLVDQLPAAGLAAVMDSLNRCATASKAEAARAVLDAGGLWDDRGRRCAPLIGASEVDQAAYA